MIQTTVAAVKKDVRQMVCFVTAFVNGQVVKQSSRQRVVCSHLLQYWTSRLLLGHCFALHSRNSLLLATLLYTAVGGGGEGGEGETAASCGSMPTGDSPGNEGTLPQLPTHDGQLSPTLR